MISKSNKNYKVYGLSDIGKIRNTNKDRFWISSDENFLAVSDGMGGHLAGEVASSAAIVQLQSIITNEILANISKEDINFKSILTKGFIKINQNIFQEGKSNPDYNGMGCTLVVACVEGKNKIHSWQIGDTRIYICNSENIRQIGSDHALVSEKVKMGIMTKEEARLSPIKHVLTQALGVPNMIYPEYNKSVLRQGDRLLLCSDGLWDTLPDSEIHKIVVSTNDAKKICEVLIEEAKNAGGEDNITVIILIK